VWFGKGNAFLCELVAPSDFSLEMRESSGGIEDQFEGVDFFALCRELVCCVVAVVDEFEGFDIEPKFGHELESEGTESCVLRSLGGLGERSGHLGSVV
jgi:hypothetical protein